MGPDDVDGVDGVDVDEDLLSNWSFELPQNQIAKHPLPERTASRLLVFRPEGTLAHRKMLDLLEILRPGDCLVLNDTTVVPARLRAEKEATGGRVEVLLIRCLDDAGAAAFTSTWVALLNASKKPKPATRLTLVGGTDRLTATVEGAIVDEPGAYRVRFDGDALAFARAWGEMPLPPYMDRPSEESDKQRYQTVFCDESKAGSCAAPTAGLHFDEALLGALCARGVATARVTLHVGPGTFLPMRASRLSEHQMHPEPWWLSPEAASTLNQTRRAGGRIVAVGTTSARVLQSARAGLPADAPFVAGSGLTRLFIRPGVVVTGFDALLTNFHLPESTLLVLVGTLVGRQRLLEAYRTAVAEGYRFYSYGDACFVEVRRPRPA